MSGTSMDAVDCALVSFDDDKTTLVSYSQYPLDDDTKKRVRSVNAKIDIEEVDQLDMHLGHLFAEATNALIKQANVNPNNIVAIGSHGQTVLHEPNAPEPFSLQIANPNIIANKTGILTVADFRSMDIAAGGQGAPLTPAFHEFQFRHPEKNRVILNIGGMANISVLPCDKNLEVIGFDTGPGNALMDDWARLHLNTDMDKDGEWANSGRVDQVLLDEMLNDDYFKIPPPKSTGIEYFNLDWFDNFNCSTNPENIQATLLELSSQTITQAIQRYASDTDEVLICGGGVHNKILMHAIREQLPNCNVVSTSEFDLDPDCIEAVTFAWLAKRRIEKKPGNLPSVTGATESVLLGAIYEVKRD
jgi:anhydro-N-acetylmuramic acid kinase